jgi:imidazolonepropionase-like amidohydrolase
MTARGLRAASRLLVSILGVPLISAAGLALTIAVGNVAIAALAALPQRGTINHSSLAIRDVTLIDGTGAVPRPHVTVLVSGGRIKAISPAGSETPPGATVVNGSGNYLIPGLWDMHAHLTVAGDTACPILVANGVTGVRAPGGDLAIEDWLRARIERGDLPGPRIFRAGPFVDGSKPGVPYRFVVDDAEDGERAVAFLKAKGVDFLKVHTAVPAPAYFALLREARRAGLSVVGHIPMEVEPAAAIESGHGSIEHIVSLFEGPVRRKVKEGRSEKQAIAEFTDEHAAVLGRAMAAKGTWFDPTLIAYQERSSRLNMPAEDDHRYRYVSASLRAYWKSVPPLPDTPEMRARQSQGWERFLQIARAVKRERVRFLVGTDLGAVNIYPGFSVHDELRLLVELGFTPLEVLTIATRNSAESLGRLADLGTIEPDKRADLILLEADPLADITNTRRIAAVVADGRLYLKTDIAALLADAATRGTNR